MKKLLTSILLFSITFSLSFAAPKKATKNGILLSAKNKFAIEGTELDSFQYPEHTVTKKGEIIWNTERNRNWYAVGWDLKGIDLAKYEYAGIRIELEPSVEKQDISLIIENPYYSDEAWGYKFNSDNTVYAFFNGSNRTWGNMETSSPEQRFIITIGVSEKKCDKIVIKSVELLSKKDYPTPTSNLKILNTPFGNYKYKDSFVYDNKITFLKGNTEAECGWMIKEDLSEYDRVRIELESNEMENLEFFIRNSDYSGWYCFTQTEQNVYEADFTEEGANYCIGENSPALDKSKGLNIFFRFWSEKPLTKDCTTIIKSVQLLKGTITQPETLMLNDVKLGTYKANSWLDDSFAINWKKTTDYLACGWKLEKLEGEILEIKVSSTDVPLRLRIRDKATNNEASWLDDGTHVFRIRLKDKKQLTEKGDEKEAEWAKDSTPFDLSDGVEIVLEAPNGVFKEGKKTVVESIKIE